MKFLQNHRNNEQKKKDKKMSIHQINFNEMNTIFKQSIIEKSYYIQSG